MNLIKIIFGFIGAFIMGFLATIIYGKGNFTKRQKNDNDEMIDKIDKVIKNDKEINANNDDIISDFERRYYKS